MLKNMLDKLYSSQNGMMYFYIISALIAFILIILIIITISKSNKTEEVKEENKENTPKIDELKSEEIKKDEVITDSISDDEVNESNKETDVESVIDNVDHGYSIEDSDDDLDLPKIKEDIEIKKEDIPKLTNDVLAERLNALKNKN